MQAARRVSWIGLLCVALAATAAAETATAQSPAGVAPSAPQARLVVQSPGTIEFEITIQPTVQTEELRVVADSGTFYHSTTIGLAGEHSQRFHTFEWHGFPVGEYEVVGELISASGHSEVVVRGAVLVIDRRPEATSAGSATLDRWQNRTGGRSSRPACRRPPAC